MWQAPSFAAKISSARLGLVAIHKTALIARIFVEDQGRLREALQGTRDKSCIRGVARSGKMHFEGADAGFHVVLDQGKSTLDCLAIPLIRHRPRTISRGSRLVLDQQFCGRALEYFDAFWRLETAERVAKLCRWRRYCLARW